MENEKDLELKGCLLRENPDPRGYKIARFVPKRDPVPDTEFMLPMPELEIILNQGYTNSCVAHAFALAKNISEYQHTKKWLDVDPYMIYGTRYDGEYMGEGMYLDQGAAVLHKDGAFLRRDFGGRGEMPEIAADVLAFKDKHPGLVCEARGRVIEGYAYVDGEDEIKTALKAGMPVVIGYRVKGSFYQAGSDGMVPYPESGTWRGNHAMVIVGWTQPQDGSHERWIVANSWGQRHYHGLLFMDTRTRLYDCIAISDTITPVKRKCGRVEFVIGKSEYTADGETLRFEAAPYIQSNRAYLPVRFVAEALGASVEWDAGTGIATLRSEEAVLTLSAGSRTLTIDGEPVQMDAAPEIVSNRMMCPVRHIAEALNCKVDWIGNENKAVITAL